MPGGIHPTLEVMVTWPPPNYATPVTRPILMLVIACIFGPLSLALLLARLWVRIRIQHSFGIDDFLIVVAVAPLIAVTIIYPLTTEVYSFNRHIWDVDPSIYTTQRKYILVIDTIYCFAAGLIKISILLFYRRLSQRSVSKTFIWVTWFSIGFIAVYTIIFILVPIFGCNPIHAFWDQMDINKIAEDFQYTCFNEGADVFAAAAISAVQDLITSILPTLLFWNLQLPIKEKLALFGIFSISYGVVAMGALRAYYTWVVFFESFDTTWLAWKCFIWAILELHVGAMCANAPALKVFFAHFLKSNNTVHSKLKNNNDSTSTYMSGASSFKKLYFWKNSQQSTMVSANTDRGVYVENEVHVTHTHLSNHQPTSLTGSVDQLTSHHASNNMDPNIDIEMGSWQKEKN